MIKFIAPIIYGLFIMAINALSEPKKAYLGNIMAIFAMASAIILSLTNLSAEYLAGACLSIVFGGLMGVAFAYKIKLPQLPQMVALLNGFGGLAAGIIGITETTDFNHPIFLSLFIISIGFITFSGSIAAFLRLQQNKLPIDMKSIRNVSFVWLLMSIVAAFYAMSGIEEYVLGFVVLISLWAFCFVLPIGGSDMSIIISVLNSFSGWSTVLVGFSLNNTLMIIVGTLIGSSGTILSFIMTKAMNRNLWKVIFSSINNKETVKEDQYINQGTVTDAAFLMENANKVIIVPGFGMAAANAQSEIANMAKILRNKFNVEVKFAIHPVAGRMPGHMNVLLAEADVETGSIYELKDINQEFQTADVAYVIGANDITNPYAKTRKDSPIYGMPILEVEEAKKVIFVKRTLNTGYAQIDNPLFYRDNTMMLFGDAKDITRRIVTEMEEDS